MYDPSIRIFFKKFSLRKEKKKQKEKQNNDRCRNNFFQDFFKDFFQVERKRTIIEQRSGTINSRSSKSLDRKLVTFVSQVRKEGINERKISRIKFYSVQVPFHPRLSFLLSICNDFKRNQQPRISQVSAGVLSTAWLLDGEIIGKRLKGQRDTC